MKNTYLSVIVPTYNEEKRIKACIEKLKKYFFGCKFNYEVIFVDDGSCDKTKAIIKKQIANLANYRIINYQPNTGKGYAVRQGVLMAKGKYVLFMDTDMSTPIHQLDKLLEYVNQFPIVIGSRYLNKNSIKVYQPFTRRMVSRLGNLLIRQMLKLPYQDTQCGFKLLESSTAQKIFKLSQVNRWGFDIEILTIAKLLGFGVKEVAVDWYHDSRSQLRASRAAWQTFYEVVKIKSNIKTGVYQEKNI